MTASATLNVTKNGRRSNSTASARTWQVLIDNNVVATVATNETVSVSLEPGPHILRVQARSYLRSPALSFDVVEGQIVAYSCRPRSPNPIHASRWLFWLISSLIRHDLWIGLKTDETGDSVAITRDVGKGGNVLTSPTEATGAVPRSTALSPEARAAAIATMSARPQHEGPSVLVVENLTKRFGKRTAFSDVSFEVGYGEVFGFLGPNGAGKTTTVRTLGTLIAPTSGSAVIAGIPLLPENGVEIRKKIAIMPESPGLYLRLSVRENLAFFAGLYGLHHADRRISEALASVNLSDRANDLCGGLSKGLRQRVGLARTLLSDPAIMFLDEPTSGLDPVASLEVHNLIMGLKTRGVTIFLTTHRLDEAEKLCDRVAIMNTKLRTVGRTEDLREQLFTRSIVVTTLSPIREPEQLFSRISSVKEWRANDDGSYLLEVSDPRVAAPEVTRALVAVNADVLSISESRHSLEDVYLELITDDGTVKETR